MFIDQTLNPALIVCNNVKNIHFEALHVYCVLHKKVTCTHDIFLEIYLVFMLIQVAIWSIPLSEFNMEKNL